MIEPRDGDVVLDPGGFVIVPKGVEHRPIANKEVHLRLKERGPARHSGDIVEVHTVTEVARP